MICELGVLDEGSRGRAQRIATAIADRCRDVDALRARTEASNGFQRWHPSSLYLGCTGLAVLFGAIDDAPAVHRLLQAATAEPMPSTALFDGIGSVLFAARYARRITGRFTGMTSSLESIAERSLHERLRAPDSLQSAYELGYGIAGELLGIGRPVEGVSAFADAFCEGRAEGGWLTEPDAGGKPVTMLGLAHGIAGLLASFLMTGQAVRRERIEAIAYALADAARREDGLLRWPRALEDDDADTTQAWCHGAPGVLLALYAASLALRDEDLRRFCLDGLNEHVVASPAATSRTYYGMCHGATGVASIATVAAVHAQDAGLMAGAAAILRETIDAFDPALPFGYRTNGPDGPQDDWGLFAGSAGIALALLGTSGLADDAWLFAFGIPTPRLLRGIGDRWKPHRLASH